jgi:hypothetical protein
MIIYDVASYSLLGASCLHFLTEELPELLKDVPLATRQTMWFMHDGAPDHFTHDVKQFLDSRCPDRRIGRNGSVFWPPRSPNLTPADLYLWSRLKGTVYMKNINTQDELWRLVQAAATIRHMPGIFQRSRNSWRHRPLLCKLTDSFFSTFCNH